MWPDGVIFALREEVQTQLFCKDNLVVGNPKRLNGTGIFQLPNGCILAVTDSQGKISRVRGQPLYRMIEADDINLMANGPLSVDLINATEIQRLTTYGEVIDQKYNAFAKQYASVDQKIDTQYVYIWSLVGLITLVIVISIVTIFCLYRYSSRFRSKLRAMKEFVADLAQQILHLELNSPGLPRARSHPIIPPRPVNLLVKRLVQRKKLALRAAAIKRQSRCIGPDDKHTYMAMSDITIDMEGRKRYEPAESFRPITDMGRMAPMRFYPRITPLMDELRAAEIQQLQDETDEAEELCSVITHGGGARGLDP
jgi:hypothetical protein